MLSSVVMTGSRDTVLATGRCALGWTGLDGVNAAELGSIIAVLDGLFYNRRELDELTGLDSSVSTDAMRLAALFRLHGPDRALNAINGDFAAAVYDSDADTLWLARDRFGVRPLYYTEHDQCITFASRLRSLLEFGGSSPDVNRRFVATFAGGHYRHIDNAPDESPFARVRQLPAASVLRSHDGSITVRRYWDLAEAPDHTANEKELAAQYRDLLLDAVSRRFAAAKSPAFTLSGGLDSSSVLSCAVARSGAKQHAYSSVYTDLTYDETAEIRSMLDSKVAAWHPVRIETPDIFDIVRRMVAAHDEPVATATWLSHFLLSEQVARDGFKTLFGGLGGDELNAGEYEYFYFLFADLRRAGREAELQHEVLQWMRHHDHPIYRKSRSVVDETLDRVVDLEQPGVCRPDVVRMTRYYSAVNPDYFDLACDRHVMDRPFNSYLKNRTYQDLFRETAPCCLRAEDRQGMAYGIRQIDPFFDHRLVEFMFRVPANMKIRDGITKRLLREAMRGILPDETRTRVKKTGWNAPAHVWICDREIAGSLGDLIASRRFRERGIFNVKEVNRLFDEHRKIVRDGLVAENHMMFFWQLINLEIWFEEVVDQATRKREKSANPVHASGA